MHLKKHLCISPLFFIFCDYILLNVRMVNTKDRHGKKQTWSSCYTIYACAWRDWGKSQSSCKYNRCPSLDLNLKSRYTPLLLYRDTQLNYLSAVCWIIWSLKILILLECTERGRGLCACVRVCVCSAGWGWGLRRTWSENAKHTRIGILKWMFL